MRCPFGYEVGDPPAVMRCPKGFPGCACGDEMVAHVTGESDEQSAIVVAWWQEHSSEF